MFSGCCFVAYPPFLIVHPIEFAEVAFSLITTYLLAALIIIRGSCYSSDTCKLSCNIYFIEWEQDLIAFN